MSETHRAIVRGFLKDKVVFERELDLEKTTTDPLGVFQLAAEHSRMRANGEIDAVEFEFPDDPPGERFYRFPFQRAPERTGVTWVWIARLKCPNNHAILAAAAEALDGETPEDLVASLASKLADLTEKKILNPWCGLCGSKDLRIHLDRTGYHTMEEALEPLTELQTQQAAMQQFLHRRRN
jgi:hypothetical protein